MALKPQVIHSSQTTMSIVDYNGTPASYPVVTIEVNNLRPPIARKRGFEEILINSAAGKTLYAAIDTGIEVGQTFSFQIKKIDPANSTDVTSIVNLVVSLYNNSMAGANFADADYTSPLTGGGKLAAKFVFTERNVAGDTFVSTVPSCVTEVEPVGAGEHEALNVTCTVIAAPTIA